MQKLLSEQDILTSGLSYSNNDGEIRDLQVGLIPVEPNKIYRAAVGEFLLTLVPFLNDIPYKPTGERVDTILLKYLKQILIIEKTEANGK